MAWLDFPGCSSGEHAKTLKAYLTSGLMCGYLIHANYPKRGTDSQCGKRGTRNVQVRRRCCDRAISPCYSSKKSYNVYRMHTVVQVELQCDAALVESRLCAWEQNRDELQYCMMAKWCNIWCFPWGCSVSVTTRGMSACESQGATKQSLPFNTSAWASALGIWEAAQNRDAL
jgi:hypothetical protein